MIPIACCNKAHFPTVSNDNVASIDSPRLSDAVDWLPLTTSELDMTSHFPPDAANWPPLTITEEWPVTSHPAATAQSSRPWSSGWAPLAVPDRDMPDLLPEGLSGDLGDLCDLESVPRQLRDAAGVGTASAGPATDASASQGGSSQTDIAPATAGCFPEKLWVDDLSGDAAGDVTASATSLSEYADAVAPPGGASSDSSDGGEGETAPDISLTDLPAGVQLDDDECRLISVARQLAEVAAGLRLLPLSDDGEPARERGATSPLPWVTSPLASPDRELVAGGGGASLREVAASVRRTAAEFSGRASRASAPSHAGSPTERGFFGRGDLTEPLTSSGSEESLGPHVLRTDPAEEGDERPVCAQVRLVVRTRAPGKEAVEIRSIRQFVDEEPGQFERAVRSQRTASRQSPAALPSAQERPSDVVATGSVDAPPREALGLMRTLREGGRGKDLRRRNSGQLDGVEFT